jgi:hypothetical protein
MGVDLTLVETGGHREQDRRTSGGKIDWRITKRPVDPPCLVEAPTKAIRAYH